MWSPRRSWSQLFIDKVTAEIRIEHIMEEAKRDLAKNMEKVAKAAAAAKMSPKPKPKIKMKASQPTQPSEGYVEAVPTSPTSSWQDVPQEPPAEFNPMDHPDGSGEEAHHGSGRKPCPSGARLGGRDGASLWEPMKDADLNIKKLPLYAGQKMMDLVHFLNDKLVANISELIYDKKPLVWEMFCSPQSGLAQACEAEGIPTQRINLEQGFDLYKPATYPVLFELFKVQRPKKLWISTMCTLFCSWVDLNYQGREELLQKKRRRERKMFRLLKAFLLAVIAYDPTVEIYWEWPRNCRGWKESIIEELFNEIGQIWDCRIDGCRYGLKTASGNLVLKPWMIRTSSLYFYSEFRNKTCVGNHTHEWLHGVETNKSAFYPPALCRAIARRLSFSVAPLPLVKAFVDVCS